jgi:hypothetical protein
MKLSKEKQYAVEAARKGYVVQNDGKVVSHLGKYLKLNLNSAGYLCFGMRFYGQRVVVCVHKLMALQKFGGKYLHFRLQIRHLNGNPIDNSFTNISLGTQSENMFDIPKDIRVKKAQIAALKRRKFTNEQIVEMRLLRHQGWKYAELMVKFDCAKSTISYIINNQTYKK